MQVDVKELWISLTLICQPCSTKNTPLILGAASFFRRLVKTMLISGCACLHINIMALALTTLRENKIELCPSLAFLMVSLPAWL
jgi:hypothetical protein